MEKASKNLKYLGFFTFIVSPVFAWGSVIASDETAVFASLSRMIWYSGSELRIFIAMLTMFIPMLISYFPSVFAYKNWAALLAQGRPFDWLMEWNV